ncbi:MAG: hypothetical protein WCL04_03640 [Verrucomicrobiota bacterium]
MKTPPPHDIWPRLATVVRLAPPPAQADAPPGFATRVVALAFAARPPITLAALCDVFSWRALAVAAIIAIVSVAANLNAVLGSDDDVLAVNDPVAEVLSLT